MRFILILIILLFIPALSFPQKMALKIDSLLSKYYQAAQFNGTALVVYNGKIIYKKSYGYADKSWKIPNFTYTKYQIGSISETFTAVLVIQLIEQGIVHPDSNIYSYLPDLSADKAGGQVDMKSLPENIGRKVTIRQLLTHTSGIPDDLAFGGFFETKIKNYINIEDLIKEIFTSEPVFEPGTNYLYSKTNYIILGAIIEAVTGKSFMQALKEGILDTLKMQNTGCAANGEIIEEIATGYNNSPLVPTSRSLDINLFCSCNGLYSTVEDLYIFDSALHAGFLVSQSSLTNFLTPTRWEYGYYQIIETIFSQKENALDLLQGKRIYGHYGTTNGFNSAIFTVLHNSSSERKNTIILLDNIRDDANPKKLYPIIVNISNILYNRPYELPKENLAYYLADIAINIGIDEAISRYYNLDRKEIKRYNPLEEDDLTELAFSLVRNNKIKQALKTLKLNASLFPRNYKVYNAFGEIYLYLKNDELALKNFSNALKLNPKIKGDDIYIYNKNLTYIGILENKLLNQK